MNTQDTPIASTPLQRATQQDSPTSPGAALSRADDFATFLAEADLCDAQVLDRARRASRTTGERIDRVLTKLGLISDADLMQALATFLKVPIADPTKIPLSPVMPERISADFVRRSKILPFAISDHLLEVGTADPFADESLRALSYLLDRQVIISLLAPAQFEKAASALYGDPSDRAKRDGDISGADASEFDIQRLRDLASEAPTIRLVNQIISDAIDGRASDIHIEPTVDTVLVRYRIDGVLQTARTLSATQRAAITSRVKIMSRLDIAERRLPQDGRTKIAFRGIDIDFRVSTIPTAFGESVVLRILDQSRVALDFETLGFSNAHIATFHDLIKHPDGIILVTGPTGSGKTTTLYTALTALNNSERKIFTVEDPIEYQLRGINQVQVHSAIGLTFPAALRSLLRQDPDIIMIGEIRDLETARIAVQASLTGHLVLSTLHTNSAASTLTRLVDMGIENYLLTSTLRAVVAQRLVRRLCPHCSTPHPNAEFWERELQRTAPRASLPEPLNIRDKSGCEHCGGSGFIGRTTIAEVLVLSPELSRLVLARASDTEIEQAARENGMLSMYDSGVRSVVRGETTIEEVLRVTRGG